MHIFDPRPKPLLLCGFLCFLLLVDISLRLYRGCEQRVVHSDNGFVVMPQQNTDVMNVHSAAPVAVQKQNANDQLPKSRPLQCKPGEPCVYSNTVDLRVIVMTFNRASALSKLLESVNRLDTMGDTIALEIWIDRDKKEVVHQPTLQVAQSFNASWNKGPFGVHVQSKHVGIYGQWIDTWRPQEGSSELALLLEDDLIISPYTWRWLKAAHAHYGSRDDVLGYTLQSEKIKPAAGKASSLDAGAAASYMYKQMGSWGFVPHPKVWSNFQDWFHKQYTDPSFHPYVPGIVMTNWYKNFEKTGRQDGMWTMWFIYYTNKHNLYCVYNNLNRMTQSSDHCLAVHRAEPGLHYQGKPRTDVEKLLLNDWSSNYVNFPATTAKLEFTGQRSTG